MEWERSMQQTYGQIETDLVSSVFSLDQVNMAAKFQALVFRFLVLTAHVQLSSAKKVEIEICPETVAAAALGAVAFVSGAPFVLGALGIAAGAGMTLGAGTAGAAAGYASANYLGLDCKVNSKYPQIECKK
ncbi:hypothetical protein PoB_004310400 [Plakobranchus ocellatus]|uniref:Uncharacterized protein n=1 Tax=Plakobranchus ocellatus TaxID=259542 RepID=A0AAV4BCT1_9GAST|nr:hypothetical protein PoB_004310400 [Plakobranchus ocellatus]